MLVWTLCFFFLKNYYFIFFPLAITKNMARHPKIYHPEPKEWFPCPVHDCPRKFRTQTGRTKHICSKHENIDLQTQTPSQNSLSLEIPPECLSPINTNLPIDLDPQDVDSYMSNVPCALYSPSL